MMALLFGKTSPLTQALEQEFSLRGVRSLIVDRAQCDFSSHESVRAFVTRLPSQEFQYVFFVPGVLEGGLLEKLPLEAWQRSMAINVNAPIEMTLALSKSFRSPTTFVYFLSGAGEFLVPGVTAYGLAKRALGDFVAALRMEKAFADRGHRFVTVYPGSMNTGFNQNARFHAGYTPPSLSKGRLHEVSMVAKKMVDHLHHSKSDEIRLSRAPKYLGLFQRVFPRLGNTLSWWIYKKYDKS